MSCKAYIMLFSVILLFNCTSDNAPSIPPIAGEAKLIKTYGGTKNEGASSIINSVDGGYAVLGFAQSINGDVTGKTNDSFDYWVLKFDFESNLQWNKTYGGTNDDRGKQIIQTSDGGFALIGYSTSSDIDVTENAGSQDFWMVKLDISGNISWEKSFGFSGIDSGFSILQSSDNGYLLTGTLDVTSSSGEGNSRSLSTKHAGGDYWVIKLDVNGNKLWSRYFGGTFTDTPHDAIETEDKGFIIVGGSDSDDVDITANNGSYDFWIIKISNSGDLVWEKSFGGSEIDEAHAITDSGDGNYLIVGDTRSNDQDVSQNNGAADLWLIKITESGDLISEKTFGGTSFDVGRSISKTQDNGFLISGSSRSLDGDLTENNGQNDTWVIKLKANSEIEWQQTVGGSEIDFGYDAVELDNNTVVLVGDSDSSDKDIPENKGFTDLLLITFK